MNPFVALLIKMVASTPPAKIIDIRRANNMMVCQFAEDGCSIEDCANWLMGLVIEWMEERNNHTRPNITLFLFDKIVRVTW